MPEPTNHEVNVRLAEFMKVEPCEHGGDIRDDEFYCGPQSYGDLDGGHLCFHCDGGVPAYTESLDLVWAIHPTREAAEKWIAGEGSRQVDIQQDSTGRYQAYTDWLRGATVPNNAK